MVRVSVTFSQDTKFIKWNIVKSFLSKSQETRGIGYVQTLNLLQFIKSGTNHKTTDHASLLLSCLVAHQARACPS